MSQKVILKKSNVPDKTPTASTMEFGEVYVNYASGAGKSFLATKKHDGSVAKFMEKEYIENTYATSANTYKSITGASANVGTYLKSTYATSANTVKYSKWQYSKSYWKLCDNFIC